MDTKQCQICGKVYSSVDKLNKHISKLHNLDKKEYFFNCLAVTEPFEGSVKCNVCNTYHKNYPYLSLHITHIHSLSSEKYYLQYVLNLENIPTCLNCGKDSNFKNISSGYTKFCNAKCRMDYTKKHPELFEKMNCKRKQTCLAKYGVEYASQTKESKEKMLNSIKKTCQEKYGVDNPMHIQDFYVKVKKTMLEKHGVENPSQVPEFQQRKIDTNMKKTGMPYANQTAKEIEKLKKTCLEKYGVNNPMHVPEFKEKLKQTCLDKYGVENVAQSKQYKQNMIEKGLWFSEEQLSDLKKYRYQVAHYTIQNEKLLPDIHLKGKEFHVDHKFSISEGFKLGILPHIIGNIENLEIIPALDNFKKSDGCSITLQELINKIELSLQKNCGTGDITPPTRA